MTANIPAPARPKRVLHTVEVRLPLPPAGVHQNKHGTLKERMRAVRQYRETAALLARQQLGPDLRRFERAVITFRFTFRDRRRRDALNFVAAMKPAIDGLVDAGLLDDDDWDHLLPGGAEQVVSRRGETEPGVTAMLRGWLVVEATV